jgi:rubrerythrin
VSREDYDSEGSQQARVRGLHKSSWQCTGKKGYLTREHAASDARQMQRKFTHGEKRTTMEAYRCRKCGFWHTGSRTYLAEGDH